MGVPGGDVDQNSLLGNLVGQNSPTGDVSHTNTFTGEPNTNQADNILGGQILTGVGGGLMLMLSTLMTLDVDKTDRRIPIFPALFWLLGIICILSAMIHSLAYGADTMVQNIAFMALGTGCFVLTLHYYVGVTFIGTDEFQLECNDDSEQFDKLAKILEDNKNRLVSATNSTGENVRKDVQDLYQRTRKSTPEHMYIVNHDEIVTALKEKYKEGLKVEFKCLQKPGEGLRRWKKRMAGGSTDDTSVSRRLLHELRPAKCPS